MAYQTKSAVEIPVVRIESAAARRILDLTELWAYRELLYFLVWRDIKIRYKQTVIGAAWAILQPFLTMIIFTLVFGKFANVPSDGLPYPIFSFAALLPWTYFATSLSFGAPSLVNNMNLVTKVYFPREILPFSAVLVGLVDLAVASLVLVGLMAYYGIGPAWTMLWLPVVIAVQLLFTAAMALLLSMANLFYRDVKYLFEVAITIWMFATSVVYPIERVGGRLAVVLSLNPMTHIVNAWRAILLEGVPPDAGPFAATAAVAVASCAAAWMLLHAAEFRFAENV